MDNALNIQSPIHIKIGMLFTDWDRIKKRKASEKA